MSSVSRTPLGQWRQPQGLSSRKAAAADAVSIGDNLGSIAEMLGSSGMNATETAAGDEIESAVKAIRAIGGSPSVGALRDRLLPWQPDKVASVLLAAADAGRIGFSRAAGGETLVSIK